MRLAGLLLLVKTDGTRRWRQHRDVVGVRFMLT